jgi:organic hydroperoxide reductase OsmC/OhrA
MAPKTAYKSFRYKAKITWSSARRGMLSAAGRPDVIVGSPPEFKGDPDIWAPEELLIGSLNTCMMLTFLTRAQAQGLTPLDMKAKPKACLRTSRGNIASAKSRSAPRHAQERRRIRDGPQSRGRRRGSCFIANSINARVKLAPELVLAPPPR